MSDASNSKSFLDMFQQFGSDMKLPSMDVDRILQQHQKNLEALHKSATASASGAASLMNKQREIIEAQMREITDLASHYRGAGNPRDIMDKQTEFARKAFEAAVRNTGEVAAIIQKSGAQSLDILRERMRESLDELKKDAPE